MQQLTSHFRMIEPQITGNYLRVIIINEFIITIQKISSFFVCLHMKGPFYDDGVETLPFFPMLK